MITVDFNKSALESALDATLEQIYFLLKHKCIYECWFLIMSEGFPYLGFNEVRELTI